MKKLAFVFAFMLVGVLPAQAQYQDLVDLKITQLVEIQKHVKASRLSPDQKAEALDRLADDLAQLTVNRDETDLVKLQQLENQINEFNAQLAARILTAKKQVLQQKLDQLAQMAAEKRAAGKDTAVLEQIWNEMNTVLQNL